MSGSDKARWKLLPLPHSDLAQAVCQDMGVSEVYLVQSCRIGRSVRKNEGIPIRVDWTQFSSNHCRVYAQQEATDWHWFVEDTSTNGTFVDDVRVPKGVSIPIREGSVVRLSTAPSSTIEFRFVRDDDSGNGVGQDNYTGDRTPRASKTYGKRKAGEMLGASGANSDDDEDEEADAVTGAGVQHTNYRAPPSGAPGVGDMASHAPGQPNAKRRALPEETVAGAGGRHMRQPGFAEEAGGEHPGVAAQAHPGTRQGFIDAQAGGPSPNQRQHLHQDAGPEQTGSADRAGKDRGTSSDGAAASRAPSPPAPPLAGSNNPQQAQVPAAAQSTSPDGLHPQQRPAPASRDATPVPSHHRLSTPGAAAAVLSPAPVPRHVPHPGAPAAGSAAARHSAHPGAALPAHQAAAGTPGPARGPPVDSKDMQRLFHSNQELRRKLEERKVALAKAEEAITELKRQLDDVGAKHVEAEAKLVERAHALEAQVSDLKGQLASAAVSKAALDEELAREKAHTEAERTRAEKAVAEAWSLRTEVSQLRSELASAHNMAELHAHKMEELQATFKAASSAQGKAEEDARAARAALEVERLAVIAAQRQADEAQASVDTLTAENNKLRQELEAARKELAQASGGGKEMKAALEKAEEEAEVRGEQLTMRALAAQQAQAAMLQLSDQVMQGLSRQMAEAQALLGRHMADTQAMMAQFINGPMQALVNGDTLPPGPEGFLTSTQGEQLPSCSLPQQAPHMPPSAPGGTAPVLHNPAAAPATQAAAGPPGLFGSQQVLGTSLNVQQHLIGGAFGSLAPVTTSSLPRLGAAGASQQQQVFVPGGFIGSQQGLAAGGPGALNVGSAGMSQLQPSLPLPPLPAPVLHLPTSQTGRGPRALFASPSPGFNLSALNATQALGSLGATAPTPAGHRPTAPILTPSQHAIASLQHVIAGEVAVVVQGATESQGGVGLPAGTPLPAGLLPSAQAGAGDVNPAAQGEQDGQQQQEAMCIDGLTSHNPEAGPEQQAALVPSAVMVADQQGAADQVAGQAQGGCATEEQQQQQQSGPHLGVMQYEAQAGSFFGSVPGYGLQPCTANEVPGDMHRATFGDSCGPGVWGRATAEEAGPSGTAAHPGSAAVGPSAGLAGVEGSLPQHSPAEVAMEVHQQVALQPAHLQQPAYLMSPTPSMRQAPLSFARALSGGAGAETPAAGAKVCDAVDQARPSVFPSPLAPHLTSSAEVAHGGAEHGLPGSSSLDVRRGSLSAGVEGHEAVAAAPAAGAQASSPDGLPQPLRDVSNSQGARHAATVSQGCGQLHTGCNLGGGLPLEEGQRAAAGSPGYGMPGGAEGEGNPTADHV